MRERNWVLRDIAPKEWQAQFSHLPDIVRQLLWNRQIVEKQAIEQFLNPDYARDLHDPFLFKDMARVVERLFLAIEKKEKIFVYGDYDADGVPGAVIIKSTLDAFGANTGIYIPHREKEGYGLNSTAVEYMAENSAKVIVTCDCGISNAEEVKKAQALGIDVIVTDHHRIPEIMPEAFAILHPFIPNENYPCKNLTGGGVAFKLAQGLLRKSKDYERPGLITKIEDTQGFEKWLLDLAAISTVADVGQLIGENRTLVKYGLVVLNKTRRLGLQKLITAARLQLGSIDAWNIAWQLAPRINAAGRMDHANTAFKLLSTSDPIEAEEMAAQLNSANVDRQKETDRILKQAREQIAQHVEIVPGVEKTPAQGEQYLLAAYDPSWNAGVIGLAAGRLTDEFRRPVLIATKNEAGMIVASGRSIAEFNIVEALANSRDYLVKFGGHPRAAGFSVENEERWKTLVLRLQEMAHKTLHGVDVRPSLQIDADIRLADVSWEFVSSLKALEPYGEANPRPYFLIHGLQVLGFDTVGNGNKHLRAIVTDETRRPQKMIGFNCGDWCTRLAIGNQIDVVVEVGVNEWQGKKEIEFKIVDLRFHQTVEPVAQVDRK